MEKLKSFVKTEPVLIISLVLAVVSAFSVTPSKEYLSYIDFRTLALLFSLMAVMAGLGALGIFRLLAQKLLKSVKSTRGLTLVLSLLCFFSSMIITNDVALITFVPFAIETLKLSNKKERLIPVVVLQTVAANIGSMLTPIGNPQNLYIFSSFEMRLSEFALTLLPYTLFSLILIVLFSVLLKNEKIQNPNTAEEKDFSYITLTVYCLLFALAILTVFKVMPYPVTLVVTIIALLIFDRKTIFKIDYSLLLTFVFLFIFIGNLGNIPFINDFLKNIVKGNEVLAGILSSQIFSNVPATLLLSGFTENAKDLLIGVNLGGLGTLIASMASLISFKLSVKENIKTGKYIITFTIVNVVFLILNLTLWLIIK